MKTSRVLPYDLIPKAFGLRWGLLPTECQAVLGRLPVRECPETEPFLRWQAYKLPIQYHRNMEVILQFDERGLGCIEALKEESRDFWDAVEPEVIDAIETEFIAAYQEAIEAVISVLGPPTFQRSESSEDESDDEIEDDTSLSRWWTAWSAWMQAYWDCETNRLQIELDQQDTQLPFTITCAAMRLD